MTSFFRKLVWLMRRRRKENELREELQFYLDEEAEQREAEGLAHEEAQRAARRDLGNITLLYEDARATWTWRFWEELTQDLRYALRTMYNNRMFTALVVLSLALGIGANTAIFSFMDSILLRSLPVKDPDSLAMLNWHPPALGSSGQGKDGEQPRRVPVRHAGSGTFGYSDAKWGFTAPIFPFAALELFQENDSVMSSVFAYCRAGNLNLIIKGQADLASGEYVSGDYFRGLDVSPAAGRLIVSDDDRAGASPVAVISFAFSQGRFGGPANATGQSILINNVAFAVIGVTPPEFFGVDPAATPDFYLPMHTIQGEPFGVSPAGRYLDRNFYWIEIMGRLHSGVSLAQAQAALAPRFQQWVAGTATSDRERLDLPELAVKEGAGGLDSLRQQYSRPL